METKNEVIKLFREICGTEKQNGYYLKIDKNIEVPNYIDKDEPVEYPEIRITPFLLDTEIEKLEQKIKPYIKLERKIYQGTFQIDIFSKDTSQVNEIYQKLYNRIIDFLNPEIIIYGYDDEDTEYINDYYFNKNYKKENSKISQILVESCPLDRVYRFKDLFENSWFLGKKGLYIKTQQNIQTLKIKYILNGMVFPDGFSANSKYLYNSKPYGYRYLSESEKNEVKRVMFEVPLTYELHRKYKLGPIIKEINIKE